MIPFPGHQPWISDRFELVELIGQGGLGDVYRAWDHRLHRAVAIKRMRAAELPRTGRQLAEQTWKEAMNTASLQHANIVTIFDYGLDEAGAYVVMELIQGETLEEVLVRGPLQYDDFLRFGRQTLEGLVAAHAVGLIHRDLKPGNFMIAHAPGEHLFQVKILDFGLAKVLDAPQPQSMDHFNSLMGSIHYMAPEQFTRQPVDPRTDLYSLGCIFYEAVTGHTAARGETISELINSHLHGSPFSMRQLRRDISGPLERWIARFIEREPNRRHPSAVQALRAMPQAIDCKRDIRTTTSSIFQKFLSGAPRREPEPDKN